MQLEWQGRYRRLVAALTKHTNVVSRALIMRRDMGDGTMLSSQEFQILENIIEHENETRIMLDIAQSCGIAQSSVTKATKQLFSYGLIARFRIDGNKKSVILRPTEKGKAFYDNFRDNEAIDIFSDFFKQLEPLSDEQLLLVCKALEDFNNKLTGDNEIKLVDY